MFNTLVYCKWWLECDVAVDAPWNMLSLYRDILEYKTVNSDVSNSAKKSINRHGWYLVPEMIPLSLFSSKVSDDEKSGIAAKLLAVKPSDPVTSPSNRFGTGFGKPSFPDKVTVSSKLSDFITEDSWFFFYILQMDDDFLAAPVSDWPSFDSYSVASTNVKAINVTNDVAERTVKLATDFHSTARQEEVYQNVIQVVEDNRKAKPNLRK